MTTSQKVGRIGGEDWTNRADAHATAVYNAEYNEAGEQVACYSKPWQATGPNGSAMFSTHAEAIAWAFEKVGA